jgi:hypothetical protein
MGEAPGGMGSFFQEQRMWEKQIATRILSNMRAVWSMRKDRDRQLDGLFNRIPPPPELVQAKVWLRYRMATAISNRLKKVIAFILKYIIKPLLDMFSKDPLIMPSYWKEEPTSSTERGVILAPGKMTGKAKELEEDFLKKEKVDLSDVDDYIASPEEGEEYESEEFIGPSDSSEEEVSESDSETGSVGM